VPVFGTRNIHDLENRKIGIRKYCSARRPRRLEYILVYGEEGSARTGRLLAQDF
jgi:hypothetical protein